MARHIDRIIDDLCNGSLTLEAACKALLQSSQADPAGTRFWNLSIEAALKQKRIAHAAGRALLDALEGYPSDRTVWIDSGMLDAAVSAAPAARIKDTERRVAALLQAVAGSDIPAAAARSEPPLTGPIEWYDSRAFTEPQADAPESIGPGSVLKGRYRLASHLGAGGIGQVFEAVDLASAGAERRVTVKIVAVNLRHQPDALTTLETAVRRTQHLSHPNIAAIHDIGRHGDSVFIVMEPLRGRWLSGLIREVRGQGMPYAAAWPIISGIASGLAHAHRHGVVHADLSPHAIFLCDDGTAKVMCFGLINALPNSNESLDVLDTQTLRAYTEAYAADPWAQLSRPHPADDLYPLGVIAYEMLTGTHPYQRHSMIVARQKNLTFAPIAGLNSRAKKLLERCLSFERADRPQNAERFLRKMQPGLLDRMLTAG
ncbi:MAG TPA: serine/threonine-protein kinase [Povalibacter sp.]|uniref:serine/threonine-protein kinase n=1 Tax=Povalibacter sp. TaxID=1962978 RepID=UPI002CBEA9E2|nr:serine/threonine-protein kinase [Povalibacter sp.]HMN44926.1 serine/threonine-protein kinase [Povalibacter sp.]